MTANEKILAYVKEELTEFSIAFIDARKQALRAKKLPIDGSLLQSFEREIAMQARDEAVILSIAFLDSGRFIDMKPSSIAHDKWGRNSITRLEDWIERVGVEKFIYGFLDKPGRTYNPAKHQGYKSLINQIAWGIAISRTKGKFKRKTWWNKDKSRATLRLVNTLAANLPDVVSDIIGDAFAPSSRQSSSSGGGFSATKYNKARGR